MSEANARRVRAEVMDRRGGTLPVGERFISFLPLKNDTCEFQNTLT
jgi:hypothetical protein